MCGIVSLISKGDQSSTILDVLYSLKNLEYRGYDSCGFSFLNDDLSISTLKAVGSVESLIDLVKKKSYKTSTVISHTRWATHGKVTDENSHPHESKYTSIVHNGIIENYQDLKNEMLKCGYKFKSQSDSEVISVLITYFIEKQEMNYKNAFSNTIKKLKGSYAIVAIFKGQDSTLAFAKSHVPLSIAKNENEIFLTSDAEATIEHANLVRYIKDGEYGFISNFEIELFNSFDKLIKDLDFIKLDINSEKIGKGNFEHFMIKEIYDQPDIVMNIINKYIIKTKDSYEIHFPRLDNYFDEIKTLNIVACGTSYNASAVAVYYLEKYANVQANVHIASEFIYRDFRFIKNGGFVFVSQSGETADIISGINKVKHNNKRKQKVIGIVNNVSSTVAIKCEKVIDCIANKEISVASTKAFTSQVLIFLLLSLRIGHKKKFISNEVYNRIISTLYLMPTKMQNFLDLNCELVNSVSKKIESSNYLIFLGRGISYPLAIEGALKMKEVSYIPSDGIAGGELKHGPIALINKNQNVIVILQDDDLFLKMRSNLEEIIARNGKVILITSNSVIKKLQIQSKNIIAKILIDENDLAKDLNFLLYILPLQLLTYYVSLNLGREIDKPRNLAKSVTVE